MTHEAQSAVEVSYGVEIPRAVHAWLSYAEATLANHYKTTESEVLVEPDASETKVKGTVLLNGYRTRFTFEAVSPDWQLGITWLLNIHMFGDDEVTYQFSNVWGIEEWNECQTWYGLRHMSGSDIILLGRIVAAFTGQEPLRRRFMDRVAEQLLEASVG